MCAAVEHSPVDERLRTTGSTRWRRLATKVLIVLVLLASMFYVGGGWYFSGQISSGALRVNPASVKMTVRVDAVGGGQITLHEVHGRDRALRSAETYGLKWDGGYGQISGTADTVGTSTTRHFTLLSGSAPVSGSSAGLARDAYPDDPSVALGRSVQEVSFTSPLGTMPAWYVPGASTTWAILVHGWTASRTEMLRLMRITVAEHLPSLDITYRNDAGAPADPSHRYQYGRTEWQDLDASVQYAQQHGAKSIVLVGISMGGAIVASFLERSPRAGLVTALVLDSPLLSLDRAVNFGASRKSVPVVGLPVPYSLTWSAKRIASLRYDVNWRTVDYLHDTTWDRVPTLLFHGDADTRVPLSSSRALAVRQPDHVQLVVVPNANHVESWNCDPAFYTQSVMRFLHTIA